MTETGPWPDDRLVPLYFVTETQSWPDDILLVPLYFVTETRPWPGNRLLVPLYFLTETGPWPDDRLLVPLYLPWPDDRLVVPLYSVWSPRSHFSISLGQNVGFSAQLVHCGCWRFSATERILHKCRQIVDLKKDDGFSALHLAALNGHKDVAAALLRV